ncbi:MULTISPECIES: YdbL family protein [unclassified Sphingomonas]|uniref:YdbL family protein n=1 Tax=unclassified Sphingomonas TaxID=196159 RepID=UPI00226A5F3E|nr:MULTISPECIES: YdbL family protein [unclassified Sphingomonas]
MNRYMGMMVAGAAALAGLSSAASAQRDPAYAAAREAKQVGEQPDGYLGVVGAGTPALQAMVRDINIKRKAAYTASAQASGATVEQFAFTSGCNLVAKVGAGEMYKTPSGQWKQNSGTPELDGRCK